MLNLRDGALWQWDTGRKIVVTLLEGQTIDKIQYYNGIGDEAWPGTVYMEDGVIISAIPDTLLQCPNNLVVYLMTTDEDGVKTTDSIILAVNKRAKPDGYILPELERFEQIKAATLEAANSASNSASEAKKSEDIAKGVIKTEEEINEIKKIADEALEKSEEADSKYVACEEATTLANKAAEDANAAKEEAVKAAENANKTFEQIISGGYVESLKELNKGEKFNFWVGTKAEYDALVASGQLQDNCMHIKTDEPGCTDYIIANGGTDTSIYRKNNDETKTWVGNVIWYYEKRESGIFKCWARFNTQDKSGFLSISTTENDRKIPFDTGFGIFESQAFPVVVNFPNELKMIDNINCDEGLFYQLPKILSHVAATVDDNGEPVPGYVNLVFLEASGEDNPAPQFYSASISVCGRWK